MAQLVFTAHWDKEAEPPLFARTNRRNFGDLNGRKVARPGGFEPLTLCFGGTRSIHLSYGRAVTFSVWMPKMREGTSEFDSTLPHAREQKNPPRAACAMT
jgi:hypothetical protein